MLSLFTRYRFVLVWTALIPLTYIHYWQGAFAENYAIIALEYGVVACLILWEVGYRLPQQEPG
jgi:hypothetical protein